jgi:phage shock protein PspC (stress-responsive transcriptional regulator)
MNTRLYRSPTDRVLAGVAGGMAETYALDPALVRIGWTLLILLTGGVFLIVYIVMALVVPLRPLSMPAWSGGQAFGGAMAMPYAAMSSPGGTPGAPADQADGAPPSPPPPDVSAMPAPAYPQYPPPTYAAHHERHGNSTGALVIGAMLILVGAFFLIRQFVPALDFDAIWPVAIIIGGGLLIALAFRRQP